MITFCLQAQNNNSRWVDLFSYANVRDIKNVDGVLYCAAENGLFAFNPATLETEKYSKTNLLNDVGISAVDYSSELGIMLVGYESGSLDILQNGKTKYILDIPWNNFQGSKAINDIFIYRDKAMISGDFGIASFSLERQEFIETTYFNVGGQQLKVSETAVLDDQLYVATEKGLYHSTLVNDVNFPNINDTRWQTIRPDITSGIYILDVYQNSVVGNHWGNIFRIENNSLNVFASVDQVPNSFNVVDDILAISQPTQVSFYNGQLINKTINLEKIQFNTGFYFENKYYGGSTLHGLIEFDNPEILTKEKGYMPDGPYNNLSFSVASINSKVWISPANQGDFSNVSQNADGISYFNANKWIHFDSDKDFLRGKDMLHVAVNPQNDKQFFVSSWFEYPSWESSDQNSRIGGFEVTMNDDQETYQINHITTPFSWLYRLGGATYDENGDLFVTTSLVTVNGIGTNYSVSLAKRTGNSWSSNVVVQNTDRWTSARKPALDQNNIWIPGMRRGGVIVLDKNTLNFVHTIYTDNDLPSTNVIATAIDQSNVLWIGTERGLRVLRNPSYAVETGDFTTEPIVIDQSGLYEALLTDVKINGFKVDKANRKWVATSGSGAYYFSDNGEQTVLHFNKKNSPLPSDEVFDIDVDPATGYVYFATEKGVVAYRGDVGDTSDTFTDTYAYPNPVRPGFTGNVIIKGLPNRASVKITDIVGNLIFETTAQGGVAEWDTKNFKGKSVASGIYLVLMTNTDGTDTKTLKIAVVR